MAIDTLTSLSRGIYPPLLGAEGLVPALRSAAATSSIPVTVDTTTTERPPRAVEAALYFCCMESVQNAAKHSGAACVSVRFVDPAGAVAALRRGSGGRFRLAGRRHTGGRRRAGQHARPARRGRWHPDGGVGAGPGDDGHRGGPPDPGSRRGSTPSPSPPRRRDVRVAIARAVLGLAVLAAVLDTLFTAAYRPLLSEAAWADHGWPLAPLAGVGSALMGAVIVSRHPRHPLGWLLSASSLLSVTLAAEAYSVWVLDGNGPGTAYWAHVAAWASPLLGWPAFTALIFVFLLSPDGHLPSPRWRWAAWVTVTGLCLHTLGTLSLHPGDFEVGQRSGDRSISEPLLAVGVALVAAGLVASAVSIAWRLRTAGDDLRRQLLWIASSAAFLAFGVVVILVVPMVQGKEGTWLAALPLKLAQLAVPLCVAVAVLRHRLVQIDLIVNRALVLALATGLVAVGYVVVVVVAGAAVGQGTTGFWPSLLATALVALAFQPIRRGVVRVADRLSFGAAAAPYEALADFSRRVGDSPDPSDLLPAVAEATGQAVAAGPRGRAPARRVGARPEGRVAASARRPPADQRDRARRRRPRGAAREHHSRDAGRTPAACSRATPVGRPVRPGGHGLPQRPVDRRAVRAGRTAGPSDGRARRVPSAADHGGRRGAQPPRTGDRT